MLRPGLPAAARLVQALSPLRPPRASPGKPRQGRLRPPGWAGRAAPQARTLRLRSPLLPLAPHRQVPKWKTAGERRGFVPLTRAVGGPRHRESAFRDRFSLCPSRDPVCWSDMVLKQSPVSGVTWFSGRGQGGSLNPFPPVPLRLKVASRFLDI